MLHHRIFALLESLIPHQSHERVLARGKKLQAKVQKMIFIGARWVQDILSGSCKSSDRKIKHRTEVYTTRTKILGCYKQVMKASQVQNVAV